METTKINLTIPATLVEDDGHYILTVDNSDDKLGFLSSCIVQEKSREEAEKKFWVMAKYMSDYYMKRSSNLDLWKPFQKGDWSHSGGKWLTSFGIHVYFRTAKPKTRSFMKGGWFLPLSNLNVMIINYWTSRKKQKDDK